MGLFMKHLFTWLLGGGLIFILAGCKSTPPSLAHPDKPNFIVLLTDDQVYYSIEYMPILERELIGKGINFTQGFVTTPLCCPSRASILSGQYAHNHDVLENRPPRGGAAKFDDTSTIATWLKQAGYRTAYIGKYLNFYDDIQPLGYVPPGWDEWHAVLDGTKPHQLYLNYTMSVNGEVVQYGTDAEDYSADVFTAKALEFIRASKDEPFFLMIGYYNPHEPHEFAKRHNDLFRSDEEFMDKLLPNFNEEDISDKPAWMQGLPLLEWEEMVNAYQRTVRSMQSVDEGIAEIVKTLEQIGQRDDTLIIFISDNGLAYGEHRLSTQKNCQFEECIRVPFVVSYPRMITTPRQDDRLVANIDIAPTLVELAGAEIPASVDGLSLAPLFSNKAEQWREALLIEHWQLTEGFGSIIPDFFSLRTRNWKYVEYVSGEKELYDLADDPYEMENLAYREDHAQRVKEFSAQLQSLKDQ